MHLAKVTELIILGVEGGRGDFGAYLYSKFVSRNSK
jgi:hypothetical protein